MVPFRLLRGHPPLGCGKKLESAHYPRRGMTRLRSKRPLALTVSSTGVSVTTSTFSTAVALSHIGWLELLVAVIGFLAGSALRMLLRWYCERTSGHDGGVRRCRRDHPTDQGD
jgi:hypothetical protein